MSEPISRILPLPTGLRYHALEWGGDDQTRDHTVVLVHGFLDSAWGWAATVREGLGDRYHVVAPDMRGHGDTDRVGAGGYYYFMDYIADLHHVIAQLGRATVSVVGHSMGGSVASYYAGSYPDRVHRLVLMEGMGPPEAATPGPQRVATWIAGWQRARQREVRSYDDVAAAAGQLRKNDPLLSEEMALELATHGTVSGDDGRVRFKHDPLHTTMGPYPYRVELAQEFWRAVACPVLLIEGDQSLMRHGAEEAERRHGSFCDVRHAVLAGAGHMMQRHQPAALAAMLREFIG